MSLADRHLSHRLAAKYGTGGRLGWQSARFDEALAVLKKDFTNEQLKETTAYQAMARIGMLYKIEEMIRGKSPEERYEERQKQAKPLLEAFFEWLHSLEDSVDRSSLIGRAVLYALNQEVYLKRYLEDGHLSIDNLAAERALNILRWRSHPISWDRATGSVIGSQPSDGGSHELYHGSR